MPTESRLRLAAQQAELVGALTGRQPAPASFDGDRVQAASQALAVKRRSAVARAWPALPVSLADRYAERFDAYALTTPLPRLGGPLADGRAFLRWLAAADEHPEACTLQALEVDLRYRTTAHGLLPRRGPALKIARLNMPRRSLVIALRVAWFGERWLQVPIG